MHPDIRFSCAAVCLLLSLTGCTARHPEAADPVPLTRVVLSDHPPAGHLYYTLHHQDGILRLRLVNNLGPRVYVRSDSLRIASWRISGPGEDSLTMGGGRVSAAMGTGAMTRLGYQHGDGSICGLQLTPCGSLLNLAAVDPRATLELSARIDGVVLHDDGRWSERVWTIDHRSTVAGITPPEP